MGETVKIVKLGDYKFSIVTKAHESSTNPNSSHQAINKPNSEFKMLRGGV